MLEAASEGLIGLEVVVDVLAAELGSAVEVVDVAVVGGVVKHRGGLGARAHRQLARRSVGGERKVEFVNVVGGLAGGTLSADRSRARARHSVGSVVVRVGPPLHSVHTSQDLLACVCAASVHGRHQLALRVDPEGRSGTVVVSRRHHGDSGHQGKGGGVHFVGRCVLLFGFERERERNGERRRGLKSIVIPVVEMSLEQNVAFFVCNFFERGRERERVN